MAMEGQLDGAEETVEEETLDLAEFALDDDFAEAEPDEPEAETPEAEVEETTAESEEPEAETPEEDPATETEQNAGTPDKTGVEKKIEEFGYAFQNINQRLDDLMKMKESQTPAEVKEQVEEIKDELADLEDDDAITKSDATKLADARVARAIEEATAKFDAKIESIQAATQEQAQTTQRRDWISNYEAQDTRHAGKGQEVLDAAYVKMNDRYDAAVQEGMDDQVYGDLLAGFIQGVESDILPTVEAAKAEPKPVPKPSSKGTQVKKPGAQAKSQADTQPTGEIDPAEFDLTDDMQ